MQCSELQPNNLEVEGDSGADPDAAIRAFLDLSCTLRAYHVTALERNLLLVFHADIALKCNLQLHHRGHTSIVFGIVTGKELL